MSDTTPVYGIVYPCGDDTIDVGVFQDFAESLDAAFVQGAAELAEVTSKPSAQVYATTGGVSVTVATDTTLTYTTEVFDNDGMANLGVNNDRLTIVTGGVYWVEMLSDINGYTTLTSITGIIQRNGLDFYRYKSRNLAISGNAFATFALPMDLFPGDTLIARVRWTGTGGPALASIRRLTASLLVAH